MTPVRRSLATLVVVLAASPAFAEDAVCTERLGLERHLRQLTFDLLGRPPTMAEYAAVKAKGSITDADLDALMSKEEFYLRMRGYHRALLRSNISASININGDNRLQTSGDGLKPLEIRGNPSTGLRGRNGVGCEHFIEQDKCNDVRQDPHGEPAVKQCRDGAGVPMPVSYDYSTDLYACTELVGAADCAAAVSGGLLEAKLLYYCDMRRVTAGQTSSLKPFKCLPDPNRPQPAALTTEVLDGTGKVIAFAHPNPVAGQLARLDRCSLQLNLRNNVRGSYAPIQGCVQREGVVTAPAPFWAPAGGTVSICAIEAQTRAVNPVTMESCESTRFTGDRSCGCGEGMRRCEFTDATTNVAQSRINAINLEPLLIAESVLRRDEDYFNMLTTRRSFVNGPLAAMYRDNQSPTTWQVTAPATKDVVPKLAYTDDAEAWVEYVRDDQHSGVLTTPSFLYRFPTQRARVNQFWEAFLCKHFAPPPEAVVASAEDGCHRENNLAKRCGCNYCHATIEPTGAHWGRFGERNAVWLDPERFPKLDPKCRDCALAGNTTCDNECGNYVMQAFDGDGANSLGLLRTYLYRTPDEEPNIVGGPKLMVEKLLQTGDLERCAVRNVWKEFVGRSMTVQEEGLYLQSLSRGFVQDGRNLKALIRRVMATDAYRRID